MITELSLHNFKSWKRIEKMRLGPITGLFGPNSSGKTSILQWLLLLKQTVESRDSNQVFDLGSSNSLVELGTFQDLIFDHSFDEILWAQVMWQLPSSLNISDPGGAPFQVLFEGNQLAYYCAIAGERTGPARVHQLSYSFADRGFHYSATNKNLESFGLFTKDGGDFEFNRTPGREEWRLPSPVKCYGFPDEVKSYYQNAGFLMDFALEFEKLFKRLYYLGPLREHPKRQYTWAGTRPSDMGSRGERAIEALLAAREKGEFIIRGSGQDKYTVEEYTAHWLRKLGLIENFEVKRISNDSSLYQVLVKKTGASSPVLLTDVGFGISQILPVIVLCYYVPPGSTVILEQPEIHLHPAVQAGLADVLIDAIQVRGIQVILESHSEHLLRRLQRRIAEEKLGQEDVALYFCELENGESHLLPLEVDTYGNIANWPRDFFGDEMGEMAAATRAAMSRKMRTAG